MIRRKLQCIIDYGTYVKPVFACNWLRFYVRLSNCRVSFALFIARRRKRKNTLVICIYLSKKIMLILFHLSTPRETVENLFFFTENLTMARIYIFYVHIHNHVKNICIFLTLINLLKHGTCNFILTLVFDNSRSEIRRSRSRLSSRVVSRRVPCRSIVV